ncbi:unnamed protein product [marine sediment metagenome]|uniref:Uncharacterized protein n=1 Tax=marine sediment metagenome TaxID=412755 RepID=X1GYV3_9ZZZZ
MIKALFKFSKLPNNSIVVDTTSNSGQWSGLSPFILSAPPAIRFENLWQFSKVYHPYMDKNGDPTPTWFEWQLNGFNSDRAHRYPMGKGAIPEYSYWNGQKLGYIEARKQIYIPEYAKNVVLTDSYKRLEQLYRQYDGEGKDLILLDYDAYDHNALGLNLEQVLNNPRRKMGHAFVLIMLLNK